jgi:hypothetical protein
MARKLVLFAAAVSAVLVLAIPAMASAAPELTSPPGVLVPVGTAVTATSSSFTFKSEAFKNITCSNVVQYRIVSKNISTAVQMIENTKMTNSTGECLREGVPYSSLKEVKIPEIAMTEPGKGKLAIAIKIYTGAVTCTWSVAGVPLTYVSGTNTFSFKEASMAPSPTWCQAANVSGEFALTPTTKPSYPTVLID